MSGSSEMLDPSELIVEALKSGPKMLDQLVDELGLVRSKVYELALNLVRENKLLLLPKFQGGEWISVLCIPDHLEQAAKMSGYVPLEKLRAMPWGKSKWCPYRQDSCILGDCELWDEWGRRCSFVLMARGLVSRRF